MHHYLRLFFWAAGLLSAGWLPAAAQIRVSGLILDENGSPVSGANVFVKGPDVDTGVQTDSAGNYTITFSGKADSIFFVMIGYQLNSASIDTNAVQIINAVMHTQTNSLDEVVISSKRKRYRNKDNPAVELIRQVIRHKDQNKPEHYDRLQYQQYEKLQIGTSNTPKYLPRLPIIRKYRFIFENIDSLSVPGKAISPLYLEENFSDVYYRKNPEKKKSYRTAGKKVTFDSRIVDDEAFKVFLRHLYQDVDIYENNISLITNTFLSPIADGAPIFYKYFISDTLLWNNTPLIQLDFIPRNKKDFLFNGTLWITLDGNFAVQHADLNVSNDVNLNWVSDLGVQLEFEQGADRRFQLSKNVTGAYFSILNGKRGIYASRTLVNHDFKVNPVIPDSIMDGAADEITRIDSAATSDKDFWIKNRPVPLTKTEAATYYNMDSLIHMKSFRTLMSIGHTVFSGYKNFEQVELGSIYSLYSFNDLEGSRLRTGARTTDAFSKSFYSDGYLAYGIKDGQWKYLIRGAYIFNHTGMYSFPIHYLRIGYQHDVMIPGQEFQYASNDNFLLSFKRGNSNSFVYFNSFKADYVLEFANIMKIAGQFSHQELTAAGALNYVRHADSNPDTARHITISDIGLEWGWKPFQKFVQRRTYRTAMPNKYPNIIVNFNFGIKGLWGSDYSYQSLKLHLEKRSYLSQLGYADISMNGGYVFGQLPYPLLSVPHANQTYIYQLDAFNLMNSMEFVSDHYAVVNIDYHMMGFLFNKIPLIKKLNLRETANFKMIYGGLRSENDPALHPELFAFPKNEHGNPITYILNQGPYIEVSAGIENLFNLLRVDVIRRFSYLDHPNVTPWGVRAMITFDF